MGFIETPYRAVSNGVVDFKSDPLYLSAEEEKLLHRLMLPLKKVVILRQSS